MEGTDLTKNPPSTIKELGIHMAYMSQQLTALTNKMEELPNGFVSIQTHTDLEKSLDKRLTSLEKSKARAWVWNTLSAVAGAVLLFLINYALTH